MGLTGLAVALALSYLGKGPVQEFFSFFFYPIGFIVVVIGRAQLFTENTLFPVVLVLDERKHILNTLRLWAAVFVSNVAGAVFFGWLVMKTGALSPNFSDALADLGLQAANGHFTFIFAKGIIGGWLIALVAWMITASHWTIGQQRGNYSGHHVRSSAFQQLFSMAAPGYPWQYCGRCCNCELVEFWTGPRRQGVAENISPRRVHGTLLPLRIRSAGCIIERSLTLFFEARSNGNIRNRGDTRVERSLYAA
jgi:hypothetical protein